MSFASSTFAPGYVPPSLHSQDAIRDNTMAISSRPLRTPSSHHSPVAQVQGQTQAQAQTQAPPHPPHADEQGFIFPDLGANAAANTSRTSLALHSALHAGPRTAASSVLSFQAAEDHDGGEGAAEAFKVVFCCFWTFLNLSCSRAALWVCERIRWSE